MRIENAQKLQAAQVLNESAGLSVPPYQRAYKWESIQVARLIDSILLAHENKERFFLGTLLLRDPRNGSSVEIVDGQQRIVTLFLLLAAITERTGDDDNILYLSKTPQKRLRIELSAPLTDVLPEPGERSSFTDLLLIRHKGTGQAKVVTDVYAEINRKIRNLPLDKIRDIRTYILKEIEFVQVVVNEPEDAYSAFEILNSTSTPLSLYELTRSYTITRGGPKFHGTWRVIDKNAALRKEPPQQENFITLMLSDVFFILFRDCVIFKDAAPSSFPKIRRILKDDSAINSLQSMLDACLPAFTDIAKTEASNVFLQSLKALNWWQQHQRSLVVLLHSRNLLSDEIKSLFLTIAVRFRLMQRSRETAPWIKIIQTILDEKVNDPERCKEIIIDTFEDRVFVSIPLSDKDGFTEKATHYNASLSEAKFLLQSIYGTTNQSYKQPEKIALEKELGDERELFDRLGNWRIPECAEQNAARVAGEAIGSYIKKRNMLIIEKIFKYWHWPKDTIETPEQIKRIRL